MNEPMDIRQEDWARESAELSQKFTKVVSDYQKTRIIPGRHHVYLVMAALAFTAMIVIRKLDKSEQKKLRDFFVSKFDSALKEHGE